MGKLKRRMKIASGTIDINGKPIRYSEHFSRDGKLIPNAAEWTRLDWDEIPQLQEELDKKSRHLLFMRKKYASMLITELSALEGNL